MQSAYEEKWSKVDRLKINERLSIYIYTIGDDCKEIYNCMKKLPLIPKNIIVKAFGYKELKEKKPSLMEGLLEYFPLELFNYVASIHVSYEDTRKGLTVEDANKIFQSMREIKENEHKTLVWSAISIDAEPFYEKGVTNTTSFHMQLIKQFNEVLGLPVWIYAAPSKFTNEENGLFSQEKNDFERLISMMSKNAKNIFLIPAYADVRVDDLKLTQSVLDNAKAPYELIIDVSNDRKTVEEKVGELTYERLTLYKIDRESTPRSDTMELIAKRLSS